MDGENEELVGDHGPIPGMRRDERLRENFGAAEVKLTTEEFTALENELCNLTSYGDCKDSDVMKLGTVKNIAKD